MQRLIRSSIDRLLARSPRVRGMVAGMLGHRLTPLDLDFLRAIPQGLVVDLDRQFDYRRSADPSARGLESVLWSVLWEASATRRIGSPCPLLAEFRLRGKRFRMELDLAESPECGYALRNPTIELTSLLVAGGDVMLDIGANAGFHALTAACFYRRVVAFEPTPATADRLARSVALSGFGNVELERCALSNANGTATFAIDPTHCGTNRIGTGAQTLSVPMRRLDDLVAERGASFGRVSLAKIDVEGHECEVLEGARELVARDRPTLFVEFNTAAHFDRFRAMLPAGYRACTVDVDGRETPIATAAQAVAVRDVTFRA
ncbi:MAG: FkbM family methyltransferase [Phycisphaerae bacterium]|nr:FkbM family methyltransferase [Phycisphaerae bacterium]